MALEKGVVWAPPLVGATERPLVEVQELQMALERGLLTAKKKAIVQAQGSE